MAVKDVARRTVKRRLGMLRRKRPTYPAMMGDGLGNVEISGRAGWVYVRIGHEMRRGEAFNQRVPNREDLPVVVGYDDAQPELFQVLSIREVYTVPGTGLGVIPQVVFHHETHEWPTIGDDDSDGSDLVYPAWRQIRDLRVYVSSGFTVGVARAPIYRDGLGWTWVSTQSLDLTTYRPTTGARFVLIYLDGNGTLSVRAGSIIVPAISVSISDCPAPMLGEFPLAAVRLYQAQTQINETRNVQDIIDLRWPQTYQAMGGSVNYDALVEAELDFALSKHIVEG